MHFYGCLYTEFSSEKCSKCPKSLKSVRKCRVETFLGGFLGPLIGDQTLYSAFMNYSALDWPVPSHAEWLRAVRKTPSLKRYPKMTVLRYIASQKAGEDMARGMPEPPPPAPKLRAYKTTARERARSRAKARIRKSMKPPESCEACGCLHPHLHAHHSGLTFSELYDLGLVDDMEKHRIAWLCPACHAKAHEGEAVGRLLEANALVPDSGT